MSPHEECGFRLKCGLKKLLLYEGEESSTTVPHGLHTIADAIVPDGWHTTVAALVEFTAIFLSPSFYGDSKKKYRMPIPLLAWLMPSQAWQY
jgi:hypothetical protein